MQFVLNKLLMKKALLCLIACVLCCASCVQPSSSPITEPMNAVYYWRTVFTLDSTEQAFLVSNNIRRIYCRYFDVVLDAEQGPMPNATISFASEMPDSIEIVPTVFIMNDCMQEAQLERTRKNSNEVGLARLIVERILQMNETHDILHVRELQIDCDYTARNRTLYYRFLDEVRREARQRGLALSVTVRLHQLSMPAPPADYGVLMFYNTGDPARYAERNPILDIRDVQPYLRYLRGYALPMGAAYPVFLWQRDIHGAFIEHVAEYDDILRTKQLVEAERSDLRQLILTYHLDTENIKRYTPTQYETIYHH